MDTEFFNQNSLQIVDAPLADSKSLWTAKEKSAASIRPNGGEIEGEIGKFCRERKQHETLERNINIEGSFFSRSLRFPVSPVKRVCFCNIRNIYSETDTFRS